MRPRPPRDWDDDRLDAAFAARSAATPPTPSELAAQALVRIERGGLRAIVWPRLAVTGAVAALVVVLAGSMLLRPSEPAPGASNPPGATNAPSTADPVDAVLEALGDPMTVTEALVVRDSDASQQEILVQGFLRASDGPCLAWLPPRNPAFPPCGQWLDEVADQPELAPSRAAGTQFNPSFALVQPPPRPKAGAAPVPMVLLGHFNDRRASLCEGQWRCEDTFVVDRVVEVDGQRLSVRTDGSEAGTKDSADVVDALAIGAAPGSIVAARRLLEVGDVMGVEPVLANDPTISAWGDGAAPFWLVTVVDLSGPAPVARTFALIDGSDWFAEVTAEGAVYLERTAPVASAPVQSNLPSADPSAFDSAPTSILGIPVQDIATIQRDRRAAMDELGRTEFAIRAWYVSPNPAIRCDDPPRPIHEPRPPCDEARHWLLDDPSQFGEEPGQLRLNPALDHYTPVINPLLPIDIEFDVGETWRGGMPVPRPVIVLGHFNDDRVDTFAGNLYFVVDALAWTPDRPAASLDRVSRLTTAATEDVSSVLARVEGVIHRHALATWATVADAADFVQLDRRSSGMREFTSGAPVWTVAQLVRDENYDRDRLAVVSGFTADGGSRVWFEECPDCSPDLGTPLEIVGLNEYTPLVRVFDYDRSIASIGQATGLTGLDWQKPRGNATDYLDVARGRNAREVVLRWFSPDCDDVTWNVKVSEYDEGEVYLRPYIRNAECEGDTRVVRRILIEFHDPIDMDKISGPSCCG